VAKYHEGDEPKGAKKVGWYGWKSLIGLGPAYSVLVLGLVTDETTAVFVGGAGAILMNPIVHWAHGNKGRGWLSLGLNIGVPVVGYEVTGSGYGALAGWVVWHAVDVGLLQRHWAPEATEAKTALGIQSLFVMPMMDKDRKGLTLIGQF